MSESPPPADKSKLIRILEKKIKNLEEEIAFLQKENLELSKSIQIIEYHYIMDEEDNILTGFFRNKVPEKT
jgi:hypothetical protein